MTREKAWNTAISSVHGDCKSSSSRARPRRVEPGALGEQDVLPIALRGGLRIDPADRQALERGVERFGQTARRVGPLRTRMVLVARAQPATLREAARTHDELTAIGLSRQYLVINGVLLGQGVERRLVLDALLFQPGQRAKAGGVAFAVIQKGAPGARQLEQAYRVASRRRIENDVIVVVVQAGVGEQIGKFVERGDLGGARAGELFFHAFDDRVGKRAARRAHDAVAVALCRGLRVDFKRGKAWNGLDGGDPVADAHAKHLSYVRGRIGAYQQDASAGPGQLHGSGAGNRGFPHASLAGEEEEGRGGCSRNFMAPWPG